jgi:amino acid permease
MGDSLIYSTLVARSLAQFFVDLTPAPWAFDMYLGIFFFFSLPLCYFDFQKTKLLQMTTLAIRNISLYIMIGLAIARSVKGGRKDSDVPTINLAALPNLFGGAVYSFMCHHSLPGIVTPMRNKAHLQRIAGMAYGFVVVVYLASLISCGFAFGVNVKDPLTFNFPADEYGFIGNFLFLFPVFTLTSTFPMLSITLRNNIETLILYITNKGSDSPPPPQNSSFRQLMLTLLAVVPPTLLSFIAHRANVSVDELVGFTGAFAGCAVMLIIPAALVYCSRKVFDRAWNSTKGSSTSKPANFHHSPFAGQGWVVAILAWAGVSLIFNTYEKIFAKLPSA